MLGDNQSTIISCTIPSSSLKKKHNAVAYHRVREAVAAGMVKLFYVPTNQNIADTMTKLSRVRNFVDCSHDICFSHLNP